MNDNIHQMPLSKKHIENEDKLYKELNVLLDKYAGKISVAQAIGILEISKDAIITRLKQNV